MAHPLFLSIMLMIMGWVMPLGVCAQHTSDKPNFVIVFTDDQSYRAIGYNNPKVLTPHLDALAKGGLIFDLAFTASPVCVASRASILTGLSPQTNGTVALDSESFVQNIVERGRYPTLAQLLSDAGYATYFSGKSHLGDPKDYGFQFGAESSGYDDKDAFDQAHQLVGELRAESPFLLWLAPRQPHLPLHPSQQWLDLYNEREIQLDKNFLRRPLSGSLFNQGLPGERLYRDTDYVNNYKSMPSGPPRSKKQMKTFMHAYYATISHLDTQIGDLISHLEQKGLMENTIIIFLSDNGYFLGNHGLGNKLTMHEESVRVPLFIYGKSPLMSKGRTEALVSSLDIMPTILDLAGANVPDHLQGISLKSLLFEDISDSKRDYVASESVGVGGSLGTGHRMVRTKDWKYILSDENEEAFFDMRDDPFELRNLIDKKAYLPQLKLLREYYNQWREDVEDEKALPPSYMGLH